MSEQRHIIKRQILELKIQGREDAQQLQAELSRVYHQRIVPLIDRYCTELSAPDCVHRIELLEVDVGYVDPDQLGAKLVAKLSIALRQALAEQISEPERITGRQDQSPQATSQLELFAFFARTGSLPWWADASQPHLLDDCLQYLLRATPEPLCRLMRELGREGRPLQRIVYHYANGLLSSLFGLLASSLKISFIHESQDLGGVLEKIKRVAGRRTAQVRQSTWTNILHVASLKGKPYTSSGAFYREVLIRIAIELGMPYDSLMSDIHQVIQEERVTFRSRLKDTLEGLYRERPRAHPTNAGDLTQHLAQLQTAGGPLAGLWAALRMLVPRLPTPIQGELLAVLRNLESGVSASETAQRILYLLQSVLASQSIPQTVIRDMLTELRKLASSTLSSVAVSDSIQVFHETLNKTDVPQTEAELAVSQVIVQRLEQLQTAGGPLAGLWTALRPIADKLPASTQEELLTALKDPGRDVPTSETVRRILYFLRPALASQSIPQNVINDLLTELRKLASSALSSTDVSDLIRILHEMLSGTNVPQPEAETTVSEDIIQHLEPLQETSLSPAQVSEVVNGENTVSAETQETPVDLHFSDADELYVGNAGLPILWPFLSHFFEQLGLLDDRQFKHPAARQRAVGLLQYLATEESTFPEYLLPLNKVLCGMELTDVFDFGLPLSESEAEECPNLLSAVIEQAPILHDMSVPGFRGTFLLRQGVLSTRDGAWLLRVERETYDIVLDCFPWGWEWVKLPWMEAPLRVEW